MESDCTPSDCTGIVLAGGAGRRMGTPKARLILGGEPLLPRVISATRQVASRVIVVTAPDLPVSPSNAPDISVLIDQQPRLGPLMGLYTGLSASHTQHNVVVGCDMPFLNASLLRHIAALSDGYEAVVPVLDGQPQYLHAVYTKACIPAIEALLARDLRKLGLVAEAVRTRYLHRGEWEVYDPEGRSFVNLNTLEDLAWAEDVAGQIDGNLAMTPGPIDGVVDRSTRAVALRDPSETAK